MPTTTLSYPKFAAESMPRLPSTPSVYIEFGTHVADWFELKSLPLESKQSGLPVAGGTGTPSGHPVSASITHVSELAVDGRSKTSCGGLPTRIGKLDHMPSFPLNDCVGGIEIGAGNDGEFFEELDERFLFRDLGPSDPAQNILSPQMSTAATGELRK